MSRRIKWGDMFYCDLGKTNGSVQYGERPVIVIQNNTLNEKSSTVVVAVISSVIKRSDVSNHIVFDPPENSKLPMKSMIMIEQIKTVDVNTELMEYIGRVRDKAVIQQIRKAIMFTFGIPSGQKSIQQGRIMTLCPECAKQMYNDGLFFVHRVDRDQSVKKLCDQCRCELGWLYIISDKNANVQNEKSHSGRRD